MKENLQHILKFGISKVPVEVEGQFQRCVMQSKLQIFKLSKRIQEDKC